MYDERLRKIEKEENVIPIELTIEGLIDSEKDKTNYNSLNNIPTLNGNTIIGNMTNETLGIPTKASDLIDDGAYLTEQTQVDWAENDITSPAYIKNRPFYINDLIDDVSILNGNYTIQHFTEIGLGYKAETDTLLVPYKKYKIIWDGEQYYMTALPGGGTRVYIGDINTAPYFRFETYKDLEGKQYILIDHPSDVDAVHAIQLTSLTSKPVATENLVFTQFYMKSENKLFRVRMNDNGEFVVTEQA